jgi:hypothetical protein
VLSFVLFDFFWEELDKVLEKKGVARSYGKRRNNIWFPESFTEPRLDDESDGNSRDRRPGPDEGVLLIHYIMYIHTFL